MLPYPQKTLSLRALSLLGALLIASSLFALRNEPTGCWRVDGSEPSASDYIGCSPSVSQSVCYMCTYSGTGPAGSGEACCAMNPNGTGPGGFGMFPCGFCDWDYDEETLPQCPTAGGNRCS